MLKGCFYTLRMGPNVPDILCQLIDSAVGSGFNFLCLELEKGIKYDSIAGISAEWAWSKQTIRKLVNRAKKVGLEIIPLVPLFSHVNYILECYPQYREPESKIYCPSSGILKDLISPLIDEVIQIFEPRYLHIGHDEILSSYDARKRQSVFTCEKCRAKQPHEILVEEITALHNYLAERSIGCWMWADSLLDPENFAGKAFAQSGCYGGAPDYFDKAISLLPKDITLCDWHYEPAREFPTLAYLQSMGFDTLACPLYKVNSFTFGRHAKNINTEHFKGMMATSWNSLNMNNLPYMQRILLEHSEIFSKLGEVPTSDVVLEQVQQRCTEAKMPFTAGKFQREYKFDVTGRGIYDSEGWYDFRYMEYPDAVEQKLKHPVFPNALEIKAGRKAWIEYRFKCEKNVNFKDVKLKIWMTQPGMNRVILTLESNYNSLIVCEDMHCHGNVFNLPSDGTKEFSLRFEAENTKKTKIDFLTRFDLIGTCIKNTIK